MKHLNAPRGAFVRLAVLTFAALLALASPAEAQDIKLRIQSGNPLGDRMRVDSGGGLVALGSLGIGLIPQSGAGDRMMWYPYRSTFRAGRVTGDGWDDANLGFFSIAAGYDAKAQDLYTVSFGFNTNADGDAAIAMGHRSTADADYSLAIGRAASANGHIGAMVFADGSTSDSLEASAANQFSVRASGGVRIYTNNTRASYIGVTLNAGGSTWNAVSDRNRKEHFLSVDGEDVLARIRSLPLSTWRYISEEDRSVRHIGPMAQDWHRAFGFSGDSLTINQGDFDGVNLAGIQALDQRTERQQAEIAALREQVRESQRQNEELRARNAELASQLEAQELRLRRLEAALPPRP